MQANCLSLDRDWPLFVCVAAYFFLQNGLHELTGHYCRFPSYFTIGILSVLFSGASKGGARGARPRLFLAAALARRAEKKFL